MKIRSGFVSNSSSSSFVAVGIEKYIKYPKINPKFDAALMALVGKFSDDITYEDLDTIWVQSGTCFKDGISLYTSDAEPFFIGIDIEDKIKADKRLSEIKKECQQLFKNNLKVSITLKELQLKIGECSSG